MTPTDELDDAPLRLDLLIEACMQELGMDRAEAEAEVRSACGQLDMPMTEVGHA